MSELTFKAIEKDGIEFYVSNDGKQTGMSIRGLARCCGVGYSTMQGILTSSMNGSTLIEKFKPLAGKVFIDLGVNGTQNNAKIIPSEICSTLITYYAFESKNASNETAKITLSKFASIGIDSWIKKVTGYEDKFEQLTDYKLDQILNILIPQAEKLKALESQLNELQPVVKEYTNVKNGIRTNFRGLETLIESVKDEEIYQLTSGNKYTLTEWLLTKGITLDRGGMCKFGRTVAETFKSCTKDLPKKKNYKKANGKYSNNCTAYSEEHFPLLEMALNQFIQG